VHLLDDGLRPICIVPHRLTNLNIFKQDNGLIAAGPVYGLRDCIVVFSRGNVAGVGETGVGSERATCIDVCVWPGVFELGPIVRA